MNQFEKPWRRCLARLSLAAVLVAIAASSQAAGTDLPQSRPEPFQSTLPFTSIVGVDSEQISCFLGGVSGGKILTAEDLMGRLSRPTQYNLYNLSGAAGVASTFGAPVNEGSDGECADLWRHELALEPKTAGGFFTALYNTGAAVNPLPKTLEILPEPRQEHILLVRNFLSRRNIATPDVNIVQSVRTDLDGDGVDDWILNAVRQQPAIARKGDYSVILVLRGVGKGVRTYIVQDEITLEDSPYPSILWVNQIVGVIDVDGDGFMEIVLTGSYVYGGGWEVIRFNQGSFEHVLFCGCDG